MIFSVQTYAEENSCEQSNVENTPSEQIARRGCCSHHSGVCNCSGGRIVCCDGSFSPSCTCNKEENKINILDSDESTKG